ncbi:MAG: hypothetical protein IIB22_03915 [Chloroflexi bacterium]|nr:hypothetical protein [Chloroflexota bacterium]
MSGWDPSMESEWAIAGLTVALILVTGFYAWSTHRMAADTKRMADVAEREANARRASELDMATRVASVLESELSSARAALDETGMPGDSLPTIRAYFSKVARLPRADRVFDGLSSQLALLEPETVQKIVEAYGLVANASTLAEDLLNRYISPNAPSPGEIQRLVDEVQVSLDKTLQALAALQGENAS